MSCRSILPCTLLMALTIAWPSRSAAATFTVNFPSDAGDQVPGDGICSSSVMPDPATCTIRAALDEANASASVDVVELPAAYSPYQLNDSSSGPLTGGPLSVTEPVTVRGLGPDPIVIEPKPSSMRVLLVGYSGSRAAGVRFENLELRFAELSASANGGAVEVESTYDQPVVFDGCVFGKNTAGSGGAMAVSGTVRIVDSLFSDNAAMNGGGAIYVAPGGSLELERTILADNATVSGEGGAILAASPASVHIVDSLIDGNEADEGAGLAYSATSADSILRIEGTTFVDNLAFDTGGAADIDTINRPLVQIVNSTFSHNSASGDGGALWLSAFAKIAFSTFTLNDADADNDQMGDGGAIFLNGTAADVSIDHSILVGNTAFVEFNGGVVVHSPSCYGTLTSEGHNLIGFTADCTIVGDPSSTASDTTGLVSVGLGPLAMNGGPTPTHAPGSTSQAIDGGAVGSCMWEADDDAGTPAEPVTRDQRGVSRDDGTCDIGAVERQAPFFGDDFESGDLAHWSDVVGGI